VLLLLFLFYDAHTAGAQQANGRQQAFEQRLAAAS